MRGAEFEVFFARHRGELDRLARRLAEDGAADDLTGDTVLAAWRQWDRIRSLDHPLAYVRRIMRNLAATRVRRRVRERRSLEVLGAAAAGAPGPDPVALVAVRAALAGLPARRRACVLLRFGYDLPERDVAALLGIGVGTVKSQTSRGLVQLAAALGPGTAPEDSPTGRTAA
ncbi:SigE family RNA polymerase sigma factor [Pseudonocardia sp. S2-4]|uniref:SigE family RNA polymerase sigma factor n=1 Tax=Pseudonocardia humida TaxID=2800819 RepID=A0ABT1A5C1_9PSEU|nr:SigE family RNA polymerase sigma factor [Pseudonocardia humida]